MNNSTETLVVLGESLRQAITMALSIDDLWCVPLAETDLVDLTALVDESADVDRLMWDAIALADWLSSGWPVPAQTAGTGSSELPSSAATRTPGQGQATQGQALEQTPLEQPNGNRLRATTISQPTVNSAQWTAQPLATSTVRPPAAWPTPGNPRSPLNRSTLTERSSPVYPSPSDQSARFNAPQTQPGGTVAPNAPQTQPGGTVAPNASQTQPGGTVAPNAPQTTRSREISVTDAVADEGQPISSVPFTGVAQPKTSPQPGLEDLAKVLQTKAIEIATERSHRQQPQSFPPFSAERLASERLASETLASERLASEASVNSPDANGPRLSGVDSVPVEPTAPEQNLRNPSKSSSQPSSGQTVLSNTLAEASPQPGLTGLAQLLQTEAGAIATELSQGQHSHPVATSNLPNLPLQRDIAVIQTNDVSSHGEPTPPTSLPSHTPNSQTSTTEDWQPRTVSAHPWPHEPSPLTEVNNDRATLPTPLPSSPLPPALPPALLDKSPAPPSPKMPLEMPLEMSDVLAAISASVSREYYRFYGD